MTSFWIACQGQQLEQGDYLPACWIPVVGADFNPSAAEPEISVGRSNLIIVTESCDVANDKIQLASLCPMADLATWERLNPDYAKRGFWESVRQGRREGLHMLSAFADAANSQNTLVVDFRQIFSLPIPYLHRHAAGLGSGVCNHRIANIFRRLSHASSCVLGYRRRFRRSSEPEVSRRLVFIISGAR